MKLYRFHCGCVGLKPRTCTDKPTLIKMVRFFNCKTLEYGMEDIVTTNRSCAQISAAAAGVVIHQVQKLIEAGRQAC
jgi:hypothetical protein